MRRFALLMALAGLACSDDSTPAQDAGPNPEDTGVVGSEDAAVDAGSAAMDASASVDAGSTADAGPPLIDPMAEPFRTLRNSGSSDQLIDIVIVGDGYTLEELDTVYGNHVNRLAEQMFQRRSRNLDVTRPFRQYQNFFNVHRVHLASDESGIDDPMQGNLRDTALDGSVDCADRATACFFDFAKAEAAIDAAFAGSDITPDWRVVVLNTDQPVAGAFFTGTSTIVVYGGGYGGNDDSHLAREIALRELARGFANVHYEFVGGGDFNGAEPREVNVTTSTSGAKWAHWHGLDTMGDGLSEIGAYEGGAGFDRGIYRPVERSKMGDHSDQQVRRYDRVTEEQIVKTIYGQVRPVTNMADNDQRLTNPDRLWLDVVDTGRLDIEWTIDGMPVDGIEGGTFGFTAWARANGVRTGTHTVSARAFDQTAFVRRDPADLLEQTVSWDILLTRMP